MFTVLDQSIGSYKILWIDTWFQIRVDRIKVAGLNNSSVKIRVAYAQVWPDLYARRRDAVRCGAAVCGDLSLTVSERSLLGRGPWPFVHPHRIH